MRRDNGAALIGAAELPGPRAWPAGPLAGTTRLLGKDVYNDQAEDLGHIRDLLLDLGSGRIRYAVLAISDLPGLQDKLFPVPWSALRLDSELRRFVLDIERSRLAQAPGFAPGQWPDMDDPLWSGEIDAWYRG
jgi:hypothetical protein